MNPFKAATKLSYKQPHPSTNLSGLATEFRRTRPPAGDSLVSTNFAAKKNGWISKQFL